MTKTLRRHLSEVTLQIIRTTELRDIIMCKKYINANLISFESIISENETPLVFRNPFDEIKAQKNSDGTYQIDGFQILSNINILGTDDKDKQKNHILYRDNGALNFIIRLTKCDKDPEKRFYYDLDEFTISIKDLRNAHQVDGACFDFVNYARITKVLGFAVDCPGTYVVKLLIKENTEESYSVQFIKKLSIKED